MSENSESKVLYVSDGGNTNSYKSEMNENTHENYDGGMINENLHDNSEDYDDGVTNKDTTNNSEDYDGGRTNEFSNNSEDYDGGMSNEYSNNSEDYDKLSYGGAESDNESIDTCEILKVDPLMIRLNCFLKSQNGETIVEILKDIRDELVKLNKNMVQKSEE